MGSWFSGGEVVMGGNMGADDEGVAAGVGVRDGAAADVFLAPRIARWCLDIDTESWSLVSMRVSMVSSSGAGFSQLMYDVIDRDADWHREANSLISSWLRTSAGGVDCTN
jgi:hypothetical protein